MRSLRSVARREDGEIETPNVRSNAEISAAELSDEPIRASAYETALTTNAFVAKDALIDSQSA
jgi:hypothetical protein